MICITLIRRVTGPIGGAWIPYTAAQVAARRAAQMVVVVVCTSAPVPAAAPAPAPVLPDTWAPSWPPLLLVPPHPQHGDGAARRTDVPEPGTAALLAAGVAALWLRRRA